MRVVITGAAGHIGAMAAQALSVHNLVLVGRRSRRDRRSTAVDLSRASAALSRFRWTRGWDWLFRGADAVVHLAAVVSPTARWRPLLRDDIEATWHVLEAAAANGVPKVVFGSWTWTVRAEERERGASERVQLIGSDAPPRPLTPYGITKAFGEIASWTGLPRRSASHGATGDWKRVPVARFDRATSLR
jgi:uronate dehydrogenase